MPFLGALAQARRRVFGIIWRKLRLLLISVSYSDCDELWPLQLSTFFGIAKFGIPVSLLGIFAEMCEIVGYV